MNLRALDLNLLVLFEALLDEGNVTRAARRAGLSQPAMSNALARLRLHLGDPLFVRAPGGLRPTARTKALAGPLRRALTDLRRALSPEVFDPRTAHRTFSLMMNDIHELVLGPRLSERLRAEAPGIELRLLQGPSTDPAAALTDGLDLVVAPLEGTTPGVSRDPLYRLGFSVLARRRHPRVGRVLGLARYLELEHVLVAPRGLPSGIVDDVLARRGLRRNVARIVAHFATAAFLVCRSDYVVTLPTLLADAVAADLPLRVLPLPLRVPSVVIGQLWPSRDDADPGHRWLRATVAKTAAEVSRTRGSTARVPGRSRSSIAVTRSTQDGRGHRSR